MLDPGDFFVCMQITAIHNLNKFFGRISVIFIFIFCGSAVRFRRIDRAAAAVLQ